MLGSEGSSMSYMWPNFTKKIRDCLKHSMNIWTMSDIFENLLQAQSTSLWLRSQGLKKYRLFQLQDLCQDVVWVPNLYINGVYRIQHKHYHPFELANNILTHSIAATMCTTLNTRTYTKSFFFRPVKKYRSNFVPTFIGWSTPSPFSWHVIWLSVAPTRALTS